MYVLKLLAIFLLISYLLRTRTMISIKDEHYLKKLGNRIYEIRRQKNLSQEQLAHRSDVSVAQIGRIERGKINCTISTILTISKGLDMTLSEIFNFPY